jgi:hypothetical protein
MNASKIKTDFTKNGYSNNEIALKADVVILGLTGNEHFPTLTQDIEIINKKSETYKSLLALAENKSHSIIAQKSVARKELETVLHITALKVSEISVGNEAILISSGFDLCKKPSPVGMLKCPEGIIVKCGKIEGSLTVSWPKIKNAYNYIVVYCENPNTPNSHEEFIITSKHTVTIYNLKSLQHYEIKIAGIGACPDLVWSEKVVGYAR